MSIKFTDMLDEKVSLRLAECRTHKEDIPILVNTRWMWMKENGKDKEGFTKEDALIDILECLDCNGQWRLADITREEYDELKR